MDNHQLLLDNMDAIEHGVRRIAAAAKLSPIDVADLVGDTVLKLLGGGLDTFDSNKGSAVVFFRMVAWQVARDSVRAMNRGGQFSGYLTGFGNTSLDVDADDDSAPVQLVDECQSPESIVADREWSTVARAAVAAVLPQLTEQERHLYGLLASGTFDAAAYAAEQGISPSTAHVRANRLRAKLGAKLAA